MKTSRLQSSLALAVSGLAQVSFSSSASNGPSYKIAIPSGSSISSTSTGPLYFHLEAPTTYNWVALGIGEEMEGSTIFVMYPNGNGNITLSGRKGVGEIEPKMDSTIQSGLELLEGTGIVNGRMVANVRCTSCKLLSDATATDSPWIAAWGTGGSAINSASTSATLRQHANGAHMQTAIDLTKASIASDSNPFVSASTGGSGSGSSTTSGSTSTPTGSGDDKGGNSNGSSDDDNSNSSGVVVTGGGGKAKEIADYQKAHGIIMGVVVVLLFPIGAIFMRLGGGAMVHGALQIFSLIAMLAGLGIGVKLADTLALPIGSTTHTLFGIIIVGLFLLQPVFGLLHHFSYKKTASRNPVSHIHIWYGRALMILAVVNGGLGLKLAANSKNGKIAYSVVAGVVGLAYIVLVVVKRKGSGRGLKVGSRGSMEEVAGNGSPAEYANGGR